MLLLARPRRPGPGFFGSRRAGATEHGQPSLQDTFFYQSPMTWGNDSCREEGSYDAGGGGLGAGGGESPSRDGRCQRRPRPCVRTTRGRAAAEVWRTRGVIERQPRGFMLPAF